MRAQWYRTPEVLHKISGSIPNTCWRCKKEVGSMLHIWWSCPAINAFWLKIHRTIRSVTSTPLQFTPLQYLLHFTSLSKSLYYKSLAMTMVAQLVCAFRCTGFRRHLPCTNGPFAYRGYDKWRSLYTCRKMLTSDSARYE